MKDIKTLYLQHDTIKILFILLIWLCFKYSFMLWYKVIKT